MNPIHKAILRVMSSPKINIVRDYKLIRDIQRTLLPQLTPRLRQRYQILDRKIYSRDGSHEIPIRVFQPPGNRKRPGALIFFHGGGWVVGDIDTYTPTCIYMAKMTGQPVFSVDYRLAPEHPYPAGPEDCYWATKMLYEHTNWLGVRSPGEITLIGDSAGGNLAAVVSLMLRDRGRLPTGRQILVYPAVYWDYTETNPFRSVVENGQGFGLTARRIEEYMTLYEPDRQKRQTPYIAPLLAGDLSNQPDTLVITAEFDPLRDEGEAYGRALEAAGNKVRICRVRNTAHGFISYPRFAPSVRTLYKEINQFLSSKEFGY
jgi:acetyl esterase